MSNEDRIFLARVESPGVNPDDQALALCTKYGEDWAVPLVFDYGGDTPIPWQMIVQIIDGQPRCVEIRALDGSWFTATDLKERFPLRTLLREATAMALRPLEIVDGVPILRFKKWKSIDEALQASSDAIRSTFDGGNRRPGDADPPDDEELRGVARVYKAALERGDRAPTNAVANHLHYGRTTAGRRVMAARKRGFLGPAIPRQAGEQKSPRPRRNRKGGSDVQNT